MKWGDAHKVLSVLLISGNHHYYDLMLRILTLYSLSHPQKEAPAFPFLFIWLLRAHKLLRQQIGFIWRSSFLPKRAQSAPWGKCLFNQSLQSRMVGSVTSRSAFLDPQRGQSPHPHPSEISPFRGKAFKSRTEWTLTPGVSEVPSPTEEPVHCGHRWWTTQHPVTPLSTESSFY